MINNILKVLKSKSPRYVLFRSRFEFERRTGLLARKFPTNPKYVKLPSLNEWRKSDVCYLFKNRSSLNVTKWPSVSLEKDVQEISNGYIRFFSNDWIFLGLDWDYVTNPVNKYHYDVKQHWTKVNDFIEAAGDIKFVWEPSRFECLYTLVRNDYHNETDHSEFVIGRILDWIDKNPLNCGPNYKCSQETSLRVLNWLFALYFYMDSAALTDERWQKIITSIYWQINHIYKNINFSRISVRNNHAITETLTLYLAGLLFPTMPDANKWKKNGKRWFEKEIIYQFEPDGSYIQQSTNYQRVVTQLLTLGITLAEKNGERFNDIIYNRAYANLNFLYQMQDEQSGWLPNYGSNDGALFFQFSDANYRDYRPQLDALHHLLTGKPLYGKFYEDSEWYGITLDAERRFAPLTRNNGITYFGDGGYTIIRNNGHFMFLRCGSFKGMMTRDQMHIDVWCDGDNILMDGGSYIYNTDEQTRTYFAGTESQNAVMLGKYGQMKKGPRFIWLYPSRIKGSSWKENDKYYEFEGTIESFRELGDGIIWKRNVSIDKELTVLFITDSIINKPKGLLMRQIWHTKSENIFFLSDNGQEEHNGWYSDYYGAKEPNKQIEFITSYNQIKTKIVISK